MVTEIISTEGMSVLPGLWDMHVHLMINGHADYEHWRREYTDRLREDIMPASALQLLMAGVTSARDLGGPLEDSLAVREAIASGEIPGPRSISPARSSSIDPIPAPTITAGASTACAMHAARFANWQKPAWM
jgi:imidazolonepropionase-like amidohydrolase